MEIETKHSEDIPYYMHVTNETIVSLGDAIFNDLVEIYGSVKNLQFLV